MKRLIKTIVLSVCLMMLIPSSTFAYSSTNAITYSNTYATSPNYLNSLGSGYNYYSGHDCTNFVSQCLYAGGLAQDSVWKSMVSYNGNNVIRTDSVAWTNADSLKNYLKNNKNATKLGSWSKNGTSEPYRTYPYVNNSNNLTSSIKGKVVVFYDWEGDGIMNHSAFFVVNNGSSTYSGEGVGDLINQHSSNRKHVLWRPDYRQGNTWKYTTRVYAFQI